MYCRLLRWPSTSLILLIVGTLLLMTSWAIPRSQQYIWIAGFWRSGIQIIHYSDDRFLLLTRLENSGEIVCYSDHHLNNRPFDYQSIFDHLNTRQMHYSDPHCNLKITFFQFSLTVIHTFHRVHIGFCNRFRTG